jgi:hypothetical protein
LRKPNLLDSRTCFELGFAPFQVRSNTIQMMRFAKQYLNFLRKPLLPLLLVFAVGAQVVTSADHFHLETEAESTCLICGSASPAVLFDTQLGAAPQWRFVASLLEVSSTIASREAFTPGVRGPPQLS